MATPDGVISPVITPGVKMASSSFYFGLLGFLAVVISPIVHGIHPIASSILLLGGLALGVIAIVLGLIGLASINRASALAGLLFGALAVITFALYVFYFSFATFPT